MKILDQYGLEIATPSPNDTERTSYVVIPRGKSRFVDENHDHKVERRPAQNYSLHFRNQKEENLARKNPIIATRKLVVLSMSLVDLATRKLV